MINKIINILLLFGVIFNFTGCKIDSKEIDEDLSSYIKPSVSRISPVGLIYSNMGFILNVYSDYYPNTSYTLYLNKRRFTSVAPNYWHYVVSWKIPADFVTEVVNAAGSGDATVEVRVTPIQTDISNSFDRYSDYISEVKKLVIKQNSTNFTPPVNLFSLWDNSTDPVLRRDSSGNLYLGWREKLDGVFQAFFCYSRDEGKTWSQVLNISRSGKEVTQVDMEIDNSGHFYMVWSEEENNSSEVYFCRSLDNGNTWWNPRKLSLENENSKNPAIDVDSRGKIFVTWSNYLPEGNVPDNDILYLGISSDHGTFWQTRVMGANGTTGGIPAIQAGDNGKVYLISSAEIEGLNTFYSTDYGNNWHVNSTGLDLDYWNCNYPSLRVGQEGKLFLIWNTQFTGGHNFQNWISFMAGSNSGAFWNEREYMDLTCNTNGMKAAISVNGTEVNMMMHSGDSVFLMRSQDNGDNWTYPEFIPGTTSTGSAVPLDMVTSESGRIYLVYIQLTNSTSQTGSIHFIRTQ